METTMTLSAPRSFSIPVGLGEAKRDIAVEQRDGRTPGIFWLGGFRSDMAAHAAPGA